MNGRAGIGAWGVQGLPFHFPYDASFILSQFSSDDQRCVGSKSRFALWVPGLSGTEEAKAANLVEVVIIVVLTVLRLATMDFAPDERGVLSEDVLLDLAQTLIFHDQVGIDWGWLIHFSGPVSSFLRGLVDGLEEKDLHASRPLGAKVLRRFLRRPVQNLQTSDLEPIQMPIREEKQ